MQQRINAGHIFTGQIIDTFASQAEAYEHEQLEILTNFDNPLILNQTCYFGRRGFGVISESAREKISKRSLELWADPEYRALQSEQRKSSWTNARRAQQSERLTGTKRPEHSATMKTKPTNPAFADYAKGKRTDEHKRSISESLTGKPKTEEHKQKLRTPKPLTVCRICDRRLMAMGNFMNWCKRQDLAAGGDEVLV